MNQYSPTKPPYPLQIFLTDQERELVFAAAQTAGKSMSTWARQAILDAINEMSSRSADVAELGDANISHRGPLAVTQSRQDEGDTEFPRLRNFVDAQSQRLKKPKEKQRRAMAPDARERVSAAQKERWKKFRESKGGISTPGSSGDD